MRYLVLTYCPNVAALQGVDCKVKFKEVLYTQDGSKSVGILDVPAHYYEGITGENGSVIKQDIFTIINSSGVILEDLASCFKYATPTQVNDVYAGLTEAGIAKIREVVPEFTTIQDENGEDVIIEQSYRFAGLT